MIDCYLILTTGGKFTENQRTKMNTYIKIELKTWQSFTKFINDHDNLPKFIFRGQNQARWNLLPSLNRTNVKIDHAKFLHRYKMYSRGRNNIPFDSSDLEHWAIGQHHKLMTPLMDWTVSPYVAAYFSFNEKRCIELPMKVNDIDLIKECKRIINDKCAIYCLDTDELKTFLNNYLLNAIKSVKEFENGYPIVYHNLLNYFEINTDITEYYKMLRDYFKAEELDEKEGLGCWGGDQEDYFNAALHSFKSFPLEIFSPKNASKRLLNQRGLFVYWNSDEPMENWLKKSNHSKPILYKLTIPFKEANKSIEALNSMNINHLSLFPDSDGAGEYCNHRLLKQ